jgi:hypothetical protein
LFPCHSVPSVVIPRTGFLVAAMPLRAFRGFNGA